MVCFGVKKHVIFALITKKNTVLWTEKERMFSSCYYYLAYTIDIGVH